jgi:hypothetical protein
MEEAYENNKQRKVVKRKLPRGTSEYQVNKAIEDIAFIVNIAPYSLIENSIPMLLAGCLDC